MINLYVKFSNPPTEIDYTDFMLPFELLYRDLKSEEVPCENFNIFKIKLLDTVTSCYRKIKSCGIKSNLSSNDTKSLTNLTK